MSEPNYPPGGYLGIYDDIEILSDEEAAKVRESAGVILCDFGHKVDTSWMDPEGGIDPDIEYYEA